MREIFGIVKDSSWDQDLVRSINTILMDEVLTKTPGGVRSQVVDVFIPELHKISNTITTDSFMLLIEPFTKLLNTTYEPILMARVQKQVFRKLLETITGKDDPMEIDEDEEGNDNDQNENKNENNAFPNVNALYVQRFIFDMASDPELSCEKNRGSLYDIHKVFQKFTRTEMVTDEALKVIEKMITSNAKNNKSKSKSKKEKKNKEVDVAVKEKEKEKESNSSSKKRKQAEASMAIDEIIDSKKDKDKKVKKEKKQKREETEKSTSSSSSTSSDDSIVDWTDGNSVSELPKYIAAKSYAGRKYGFVFKKGAKGLGYYQDVREIKYAKVAAKKGVLKTQKNNDKSKSKSSDKKKSNGSSNSNNNDASPRVSFGKDHAKSYDDSVRGLRVSSPDSEASPNKGVLKMTRREKEKKVKRSSKDKDGKKSKKKT